MPDAIALLSIIFSWLVAMACLFISYRSGRDQRAHQERLAYDARSWQTKSEGLFDLIATCRSLADAIERPGSIETMEALDAERGEYEASTHEHIGVSEIGVKVADAVERLRDLVPIVEVYGSASCRQAFHDLRRLLRDSGYDPRASDRLEAIRRGKVAAIDAKDYRSAATARRLEREVLDDARARLTLDLSQAQAKAERLIDAARESVEGAAYLPLRPGRWTGTQ